MNRGSLLPASRLRQFVAGQGFIDFDAPGVDAATQRADILEPMPGKICGGVEAAHPVMADKNDQLILRPAAQFMHEFLRKERALRDMSRVPFLLRTHVEQLRLA